MIEEIRKVNCRCYLYETVRHIDTKKKVFFWLPFENMTYEMKEKTFVFTILRKKVLITDTFYKYIYQL